MSADIIQARYGQLEQIAQEFGVHAEAMTAMHQRMRQVSDALAHGGWEGRGSNDFFTEMNGTLLPANERLVAALYAGQDVMFHNIAILKAAEEAAARVYDTAMDTLIDSNGAGGVTLAGHGGKATPLPGGPVFDAAGNIIRTNLTVDEFQLLTAEERIHWVREMQKLTRRPWFENIADIISFFDESATLQHMAPGSWASWADAGVLEAIQNGWVLFKGGVPVSLSGGAADKWHDFYLAIDANEPISDIRSKWAIAEQVGVNYGVAIADDPKRAGRPGGLEGALIEKFIPASNLYRAIARIPGGGRQLGAHIGDGIGTVAGTIGGLGLMGPGGAWIGGYMGGELGAETGGETGDWFTDPSSKIPGSDHGPTYYSAKVVERLVTLPGMPIHVPLFPPIIPPPGGFPLPSGFTIAPGGAMTVPTGTLIETDGTIRMAGGTVITPGGNVISPTGVILPIKGTTLNPDGSLTLADGTRAW